MFQSKGNLGACLERIAYGLAFRSDLLSSPEKNLPFRQPLLDSVAMFQQLRLGYALAGGVAAMYYGRQRFTEDLDFVIAPGHMDVLAANPGVMKQHHFEPSCTWKLYHESGVEVDIWKDEFAAEIVSRAGEADLGGQQVRIAEPHDLIAMKLRAGRLQDDYDISQIVQNTAIDDSIVEQRVTAEQFQHFLDVKKRK